jgi:hypothetical protein
MARRIRGIVDVPESSSIHAPMHACPVDCHWCTERQCAAEGCMLCGEHGERVLAPCEHCGVLVIVSARVHVCIECTRQEVPRVAGA